MIDETALTSVVAEAGTTAGFEASYPQLYKTAYRVAFRLLGSREDADDIAQEACARAYARWRRVERLDAPEAWVARVAGNLAIDTWRRRVTARDKARRQPTIDLVAAEAHAERVDLHRALDALPRRQRDVVVLRYLADLPEQRVAEVMRCALGTVKSQSARALATLRARLEEH